MPLKGIKVIEMLGLAPGPLCGKILADFGASVIVIQKESVPHDVMANGKRKISVNLKSPEGQAIIKRLCSSADVLLDTFRPGVMEKNCLGPDVILNENPQLIYARLTGYGQDGIYRNKAGHDINYVALSGLLSLLGKDNKPPMPPVNLIADFAGGSFVTVIGILLALLERTKSKKGQVVDVSMTDGAAYLGSWIFKAKHLPIWGDKPEQGMLSGGVPFYGTYKTKDGKFMAVGAIEPQFYSRFLEALCLPEEEYDQFGDYYKNRSKFKEVFMSKNQEEWVHIFENIDACVTPVLDMENCADHPLHKSRTSFIRKGDIVVPETAPRLSRTPGKSSEVKPVSDVGIDTVEILKEIGYNEKDIRKLQENGHISYNILSKI